MTTIAPYPVYPPEAVFPRQDPTDSPSVVLQEKGRSRLAYLAGDMDATYWRTDNRDLGMQLINVIRWLLREHGEPTVDGDGLMEVAAWETETGFTVHMVNYNGPNAFRGRMRKMVPLKTQTVKLILPRDVKVKSATLLHAETPVKFTHTGRSVEVLVPSVQLYEVVALEV